MNNDEIRSTDVSYNVSDPRYNEAAALQRLLVAIDATLDYNNSVQDEHNVYIDDKFTIIVGGVVTEFYAGGPQTQALCDFVSTIAQENCYDVDFKTNTVLE